MKIVYHVILKTLQNIEFRKLISIQKYTFVLKVMWSITVLVFCAVVYQLSVKNQGYFLCYHENECCAILILSTWIDIIICHLVSWNFIGILKMNSYKGL